MTDRPDSKNLLPALIPQNPTPNEADSQGRKNAIRSQVDRIMAVFLEITPSNYGSQVPGPAYALQFQALAERIAEFQITAQEVLADSAFEYTRTEFLYQLLGSLVFPDAQTQGYPDVKGDLSYREFLRRMVVLLLRGTTAATVKAGVELLTDAVVDVIERGVVARSNPQSAWAGPENQHTLEINVSSESTGFPEDPFRLQSNVQLVLRALKPAHVLYDYRHLLRDAFGTLFTDAARYDFQTYYYEDFRRYWLGAKRISGTTGVTLKDRTLFSDPTRSFRSIWPGQTLSILSGPNSLVASSTDGGYAGRYRVLERRAFPVDVDATPRAYTTTSGGSGTAVVNGDVVEDPAQNWAVFPENEILTFVEGPNVGSYRLDTVLGNHGGKVGFAPGPGTRVRVSPSILRVYPRMAQVATGQSYEVTVDRLGVRTTQVVLQEDASDFFLL